MGLLGPTHRPTNEPERKTYKMAELNTDAARNAARTALGYSQAFDGKNINWHSDEPWPHRIELAQALDWITELSAMVLNLADRADTGAQQVDIVQRAMQDAMNEAGREAAIDRQQSRELLCWAYSKLHLVSYSKQEDALMLDSMKLLLEHGA